jgi:hypothetical protein
VDERPRVVWERCTLPLRPTKDIHDLGDLLPLIALVTAGDCVLDAVRYVIAQDFFLGAPERRTDGGYLRYHVDAIAVLDKHTSETSDLTFDATEPFQHGSFRFGLHA